MRNTLLAGVAAASLLLLGAEANAADMDMPVSDSMGLYVSVFAGASFPNDIDLNYDDVTSFDSTLELETGYVLGGAIGMNITDMIRGEVELSHSRWEGDSYEFESTGGGAPVDGDLDGHISATYLLANLWIDFENESSFTPYVGGGAGVGWVDVDATYEPGGTYEIDGKDTGFAFQLGAGLKFDLTENVLVDLGYRYKSIVDVDFDGNDPLDGADVNSHNVQLGLTFTF